MSVLKVKNKPFFSDSQLKRYLAQIMATFAGYRVKTGLQADGKPRYLGVPVVFGDHSRVFAYLRADGSENTVTSLPCMSLDVTRLRQADEFRRAPEHFENLHFVLNTEAGPEAGRIERYMPVPYDLGLKLTIWSSNQDQGFQIVEQLLSVFNPSLDLQLSNSPYDWTFMSYLTFEGTTQFGRQSKGPGEGGSGAEPYYTYSMDFKVNPIHISVPAKVAQGEYVDSVHVLFKSMDAVEWDEMTDLATLVITEED